jgi:hypothetical protein
MMGKGMSFPIQCHWWLEERDRNAIRGGIEEEPTGKIGIIPQRWKLVII